MWFCSSVIMSDEAVEKRRMQIRRKRMQEEPVMLSPQQEAVIQELVAAHRKTFDMTCTQFIQFRVTYLLYFVCPIKILTNVSTEICFYKHCIPLSVVLCPQPLDRDQKSMSENSREPKSDKSYTNMYKPPPEEAIQRTFSFSSLSSPSSSPQSLESKERKWLKSAIFTSLPHFADLTTYMIKNIINFGKTLPMFR